MISSKVVLSIFIEQFFRKRTYKKYRNECNKEKEVNTLNCNMINQIDQQPLDNKKKPGTN